MPKARPHVYTWWGNTGEGQGVYGSARGREAGYSITSGQDDSKALRADPLMAAFLRYDVIEMGAGGGVVMEGGMKMQLDKGERDVMSNTTADIHVDVYRLLLALHMKWHYQHVWAVDGSKGEKGGASYGAWRGMGPVY